MTDGLRAVESKIARVLLGKPECFITHPAELRALKAMTDAELSDFAEQHGWRIVRRIGGRQIEFYNDVSAKLNS